MRFASSYRAGFTIVELLIVIVVIGILAAVSIVAYNGITRQAAEASLTADLRQGGGQVEADNTTSGSYPASAEAANGGQGLRASEGTTFDYNLTLYGGYCLGGQAAASGVPEFYISSKTRSVQEGDCTPDATTAAGSGTYGHQDGAAASARFRGPYDVVVSSVGNIFVTDCYDNRIRMITPDGTVSTFAGAGGAGALVNDNGTAAQFSCPDGIAIDSDDNLYVADTYNDVIRKITPQADVTTLTASSLIADPAMLAVGPDGNLYVTADDQIVRVTMTGTATLFAGSTTSGFNNATGAAARFSTPVGIAFDAAGNMYVADSFNRRIRMITPNAEVSTFAGSGTSGFADGVGTAAQFGAPFGIAINEAGTMFVTDGNNDRIRTITPAQSVGTLAGSSFGYLDGEAGSALFRQPRGIAIDDNGDLIIADIDNSRIRKVILP